MERKIIEILLLYGNEAEDFEDLVLKEDEVTGDLELEPVVHQAKVFEKVYLDLQEDEMQFTDETFRTLYYKLIEELNQNENFSTPDFIRSLDQDLASQVTTILMEDERYTLSDWERKNIYPKEKSTTVSQLVSETILSLRCFLIEQKVTEFKQETLANKNEINRSILEEVKDYSSLKMLLSRKLNRVL